jgi:hypothetical protein
MPQQELLKTVVRALDAAGIDYMLTGSLASSMQGEPRSTHDIDIVVTIPRSSVPHLVAAFKEPDFYLDARSIEDAIQSEGMFNLIDTREGDKVDFWILTPDPFDQSRFARKIIEEVLGGRVKVSSPEDTILAKLRWCKLSGGSEKQFIDALRVYEVQKENLDIAYIEAWAKRLQVESLWTRVTNEAET